MAFPFELPKVIDLFCSLAWSNPELVLVFPPIFRGRMGRATSLVRTNRLFAEDGRDTLCSEAPARGVRSEGSVEVGGIWFPKEMVGVDSLVLDNPCTFSKSRG